MSGHSSRKRVRLGGFLLRVNKPKRAVYIIRANPKQNDDALRNLVHTRQLLTKL